MKLALYGSVSTLVSLGLISHAFYRRDYHFFASCVHLTKSPVAIVVLLNWGLYLAIVFGQLSQKIFFGELRVIEVEVCFLKRSHS